MNAMTILRGTYNGASCVIRETCHQAGNVARGGSYIYPVSFIESVEGLMDIGWDFFNVDNQNKAVSNIELITAVAKTALNATLLCSSPILFVIKDSIINKYFERTAENNGKNQTGIILKKKVDLPSRIMLSVPFLIFMGVFLGEDRFGKIAGESILTGILTTVVMDSFDRVIYRA